jgi:hypothetical protein
VERFITTLGTLIIMLFLLTLSIEATLDRLASQPHPSQLAVYGPKGDEMAIYTGDINRLAQVGKMDPALMPRFLRRAKTPMPAASDSGYRWL